MTVTEFTEQLNAAMSNLPYVEEVIIIPVKVRTTAKRSFRLEHDYRLEVFFNSLRFNLGFTLLESGERIWALDRDHLHDWHIHPIEDVKKHEPINEMSIQEIINAFDSVYRQLCP